jgi:DNA polymerase I-like protein with 3'-5' exonuclease and polymerase domains
MTTEAIKPNVIEPLSTSAKAQQLADTNSNGEAGAVVEEKVSISKEAKDKPKFTEAELMEKIDFKNPSEDDLAHFRELVKLRASSGFYRPPAAPSSEE